MLIHKYQTAVVIALSALGLALVVLAVIGNRTSYSVTDPHDFARFISKRDKALLDRLRDHDA